MGVSPGCIFDELFPSWAEPRESRVRIVVPGRECSLLTTATDCLLREKKRKKSADASDCT